MENLKELDNLSLKPKADMNDFIEILEKETKGMELGTKRTESLESNVKHNMVGDIEGTEKEGDEEEKKRYSDEMNVKQLGILLKMRLAYQRTIEANVVVEKDKLKSSKVKTIKTEYDKEELAVTKQLKVLCTKIFKYYLNPTAQSEQKIKHTETATATVTATVTAKTKTKTKITSTGLKGGGSNTSRAKKLDLDDANKTVNQVVVRLEDLAIRNYERLEKLKVRVENLDYAKQMECMKMAEDMGYYCIVAPEEIESEHLCAYLTTRKREITAKRTDKSSDTNVSGVKGGESGHDPDNGFYASGAASEDTDVLAFGGNVLVRNFSQYNATVELVDRAAVQRELGVTYQQFVDMCILFGSDFTGTLNKVGPVNALRLIKEYGSIEDILNSDDKLIVKYNSKITQNPHDTLTDSAPNSQQPGPHSEGFQGFDYKLVRKIFTSEPQLSIQTFQNIQDALDKYRRIPTEEKQKKFEQVAIKYGVATDAKEKREVFREFVF
ncbi:Flap endonuclease 1 [Zancudomyces culisetae]|uniref:Flap endonuclease 1 n=1 Tax=Zancudomyces culisetae TaxID=1213189 RepID=A0A1R1PG06_ZANCU|nr:Flap endonuclease 1 [Zancudomyces culisetae]|eukprot:OMH79886.1 Flap endonuclease 1 [Zancudomyces culisetae]